jgi:hypothetical protein
MTRIKMMLPITLFVILRLIEHYLLDERITHGGDIWIRYD